jgi:D-alanyl-D-alanine carboxypeptidase
MLPSGNDAALALAIHASKAMGEDDGVSKFIEEMNFWAHRLGMVNTTYNNPHGLADAKNKSTARDISRLAA